MAFFLGSLRPREGAFDLFLGFIKLFDQTAHLRHASWRVFGFFKFAIGMRPAMGDIDFLLQLGNDGINVISIDHESAAETGKNFADGLGGF